MLIFASMLILSSSSFGSCLFSSHAYYRVNAYFRETTVYQLLNRTSSRIVRAAAASGVAKEFRIVLLPIVKLKNSTSSVYSSLYGIGIDNWKEKVSTSWVVKFKNFAKSFPDGRMKFFYFISCSWQNCSKRVPVKKSSEK